MIDIKYESTSSYRGYDIVTDDNGSVSVKNMEFDSEREAVEYIDSILDKEPVKIAKYIVRSNINTYVADPRVGSRYTRDPGSARKFNRDEALATADRMTRNGDPNVVWTAIKSL